MRNEQDFAFPRSDRLITSTQYSRVFAQPIRLSNKAFTMLARENLKTSARLGFAISKKCAKRAVDRNRIKRLMRESFRFHRISLPNVDVVVMCKPTINRMTNQEIALLIAQYWQNLTSKYKST